MDKQVDAEAEKDKIRKAKKEGALLPPKNVKCHSQDLTYNQYKQYKPTISNNVHLTSSAKNVKKKKKHH